MCSFAGPVRSRMFINHSSRLQILHTTINYKMVYPLLFHAIRKPMQLQLVNTLCVIKFGTNCKPVLFEHDSIDPWRVDTSLCVHIFFTSIAFLTKGNFEKDIYEINQMEHRLNLTVRFLFACLFLFCFVLFFVLFCCCCFFFGLHASGARCDLV